MTVGAFGRCVAFQPYGGDGHVLVVAHGVDGALYLAQLGSIVVVVGIYHRLVHGEVDVGGA